ncbi:MAG: NTP transferase domain-containing protein [FCB group bacterium]|nr:NTP transferase domain-containing protein [FCB group bacterium]
MFENHAAIVLAAGKGKRMKSDLPKVLQQIHGKPIIKILLDTLVPLNFKKIVVVVGHKGEMVQKELSGYPVLFAWQKEQLGTGHAVMVTKDLMADFQGTTLIALGDVPFLSTDTVRQLFDTHQKTKADATCLSAYVSNPKGYGRVVRDSQTDKLKEIVEHKEASDKVLKINEINTGTFCFDNQLLFKTLTQIDNNNSQREYYLTDCVKVMYNKGLRVSVVAAENPDEVLGVNSVEQLDYLSHKFSFGK